MGAVISKPETPYMPDPVDARRVSDLPLDESVAHPIKLRCIAMLMPQVSVNTL